MAHPLVQSALLFGEGHQQTVLLLELGQHSDDVDIRDNIWQAVQEANKETQSYVRVAKIYVIFVGLEKLFV
jgi:hypothetical protein